MKKAILIIFSMCMLFPMLSVNAALNSSVYTISGDTVSNVPLYTAMIDFLQNIKSDESLNVVVKSVNSDSYSNIGRNSFVTEKCLLKSGERLYGIDTITPIEATALKPGESTDISSAFEWDSPYIMVSFSIPGTDKFKTTEVVLNNGGKRLFSFEKGSDGFNSIVSTNKKERLLRYSSGESIFAEIFLKGADGKINIEKLYINGEKCDSDFSFDKTTAKLFLSSSDNVYDVCVRAMGSITSLYKRNTFIGIDDSVRVFENYGAENIDSVFISDNIVENADTPFGTEISCSEDYLTIADILKQSEPKEYRILSQMPVLSKVQLFKGTEELFAIEEGNITVKRTVSDEHTAVMALYSDEDKMKAVSFEKTTDFQCEKVTV